MSPSDVTAIQNALLHKCKDYGRVVHIIVDKRSLFVSYFELYLRVRMTWYITNIRGSKYRIVQSFDREKF